MKSLFLLFVVVTYFATGEALKCYECASPPDSACGNQFDKNGPGVKEKECPSRSQCVKMVTEKDSQIFTARDCMVNLGELSRASEAISHSLEIEPLPKRYHCDTDLCNGASSTTATLATLMTFAMLLIFKNI